jgi:hypothetical protein
MLTLEDSTLVLEALGKDAAAVKENPGGKRSGRLYGYRWSIAVK